MKALKLIIQREYTATVKTKAFLISTIIIPIVMIAVVVVPIMLAKLDSDDIKKIYVLDRTGEYFSKLESSDKYQFISIKGESEMPQKKTTDTEGEGESEMIALLTIDAPLNEKPTAVTFFSEKQQPPQELTRYINDVLTNTVREQKLAAYTAEANIDTQVVESLQDIINSKDRINISTKQWAESGQEKDTVSDQVSFVGMALTFVMFFFVMMNGSMVMQSVVEEKTNKIVEVIVSSAKPFDLMMGKIIAVALTGFTQLIMWGVLGIAGCLVAFSFLDLNVSNAEMMNMMAGGDTQAMMANMNLGDGGEMIAQLVGINWFKVLGCFVLYFIGGYLMYAALYAMFGSAANDSQEAQQFIMPVVIIMMLAFYIGFAAAKNPEGSLAFWGSIIPFTSPIVMMVRLPLEVPVWEIVLSMVLLYVTAILCIMFAAKIYRVGILMTGKKASFKDMFKWLTYK
ncbi:ABC transporter permease [Dysgonomonas sp. 25]|uniref:ABC transporter permease n=1 Tax=Dysgonomonas sp. 25 TaxID=2302933 RepID=UPI0013D711F3|nr:ABC transporter permease [Dysgonomonas sp. 25]NDV68058.1 ABC transporter permease [Dysgonomonas sp. 25]